MKKAIILVILSLGFITKGLSQNANDSIKLPASVQLFEVLPLEFQLLNTPNPVAIGDLPFKRFSRAEVGYSIEKKDIKYIHQPGKTGSFTVGTDGYKKLKKTSFYGSFKYQNSFYDDLKYNSTLEFEKWNTNLVADTAGGRQIKEEFNLSGIVCYTLSKKISLAGKVEYTSAVGAKFRDPRNDNNISFFRFSPGILYKTGKIFLGLNGSVYCNTNDVDIDIIASNKKFSIFRFSGLGYYEEEKDISTYDTRYVGNGYSTDMQLGYKSGSVENMFSASYSSETLERRSGSTSRLIDGASSTTEIAFSDHLLLKSESMSHCIKLTGAISHLYGNDQYVYTTLKNHELQGIPYYVEEFVSCRENAVILTSDFGEMTYLLLKRRSNGMKNFEFGGSFRIDKNHFSRYPIVTDGEFSVLNMTLKLNAAKTINAGSFYISPYFEVYYKRNLSSSFSFIAPASVLVMPEILGTEYNVFKADLYGGRFSAEVEMPAKRKFINTYYLRPEASYYYTPDLGVKEGRNIFVHATVGVTF